MEDSQRRAIATIALHAAFADGTKSDAEREEVRQVARSLDGDVPLATLYRDVLLKKTTIEEACAALSSPETRQLAFELAVGVIDADGLRNADETAFLERLARSLSLGSDATEPTLAAADSLATAPLTDEGGALGAARPAAATATPAANPAGTFTTTPATTPATATAGDPPATPSGQAADEAEVDQMIVRAAVLNGALELLPQSVASMAIIPLQMKLVYGIGARYGYTLDRGHIKDLLATLGVGMTGQYLEDIGRKLLGGLLGKTGGRLLGGLAGGATGMAFSFATTWAIGQLARRYYAGGRTMSPDTLKQSFASLLVEAKTLQQRYMPQIEAQARQVDVGRLMRMVRGRP
jgi:uncharacterized protein (DUF697 family)/tellurite resistance protein